MTTKAHTPNFASVPAPRSLAEELLGRLVAFRPIEKKVVETQLGESMATIAQVVAINEDGTAEDLGERPVFWTIIRDQLGSVTEERPWIAGRFAKAGQAYKLTPYTDGDAVVIGRALGAMV